MKIDVYLGNHAIERVSERLPIRKNEAGILQTLNSKFSILKTGVLSHHTKQSKYELSFLGCNFIFILDPILEGIKYNSKDFEIFPEKYSAITFEYVLYPPKKGKDVTIFYYKL